MLRLLSPSNLEKNSQFPKVRLGKKFPDSKTKGIVVICLWSCFFGEKKRDSLDSKL